MAPTIVLISGTNRGTGKGILELYLSKPSHTVIAANRDPNHPSSKALADLPTAEGSSLILVKVDATVSTDALELNQLDMPNSAYAPSKVAVHWLTKAIHREEPTLIAFPIDPGWVQTDLGNIGANHFGFDAAPLGVAECAAGLYKVIAESTRETHGGNLYKWDGEVLPW
ncbi:hypothetical protein BHYA_0207g00100 [Botrytis hyacinthi]|uniref:NAD(P)-binding domain-containing protein n=1 Tax=Botrytis hyacinthi TaxID=278943 RepID=A0A4Z1GFL1_9HELO|nr:hypothetical protein BHYA_0207g00100 [Botrytis hyacinthi]